MACRTKRVKSRQRKVPSWPAPRSAACESEDSDGERRNQAVAASPSTTNTTSEIRIGDIKGNATTGAEDYSPCRVDTPPSARSRRRKCPPVRESQGEGASETTDWRDLDESAGRRFSHSLGGLAGRGLGCLGRLRGLRRLARGLGRLRGGRGGGLAGALGSLRSAAAVGLA